MHVHGKAIIAATCVALLLLAPVASADDFGGSTGCGLFTKQGVSGQVYAWQAGSC